MYNLCFHNQKEIQGWRGSSLVECLKGIKALGIMYTGMVTNWKLSDQEFKVIFNRYIASFMSAWDRGVLYQKKKNRRKGRKN